MNYINKNELQVFINSLVDFYLDEVRSMTINKKVHTSKTRKLICKNDSLKYRLKFLSPEPKIEDANLEEQAKVNSKSVSLSYNQSFDSTILSNLNVNNSSNQIKPQCEQFSIDCIYIDDNCSYHKCTLLSNFSEVKAILSNGKFEQKYLFNSNSLLLQFYIQCFRNIYFDGQSHDNKVIFQHKTKSITISHKFLLKKKDALIKLANDISVNLVQTDIATIPIHQLTHNWKVIPLFKRQFISRHLNLVKICSYHIPNNHIFLQIDVYKKCIIFDKNHGIVFIPFLNTQILTSDFHNVEYNSILNVLVFNLKFMRRTLIPVYEPDITKIETFVNSCNIWKEINDQNCSLKFKVFENIENSYKDILHVSKMIINKEKECLVVIFHDRIEISKAVKIHTFRKYLNNEYSLKYKFILSAKIEDICLKISQYHCKDSLDIILGLISYIQGNYISVYKNPKVITLTCNSLAEKRNWIKYIDYLKIVI